MYFLGALQWIVLHTPKVCTPHFQNCWSRRRAKAQGKKKKDKNQERNIYSLALMCSVHEVKDFQSLVQDSGMNSLRSWRLSQSSSSSKLKQDFFNLPLWHKYIATYTLKKSTQIIRANLSTSPSPGAEEGRTNHVLLNAVLESKESNWVLLQCGESMNRLVCDRKLCSLLFPLD